MLTHRQKSVLDFIQREQRDKGLTPSTREIQSHFHFASQTSVMQYIAALERKGFLQRHAGKARALITPVQKVRITDVPIYGQIPAGMSAAAEQDIEGHVSLDGAARRRFFILKTTTARVPPGNKCSLEHISPSCHGWSWRRPRSLSISGKRSLNDSRRAQHRSPRF